MDRNPTKTAAREAKRRQRLGPDAACVRCNERQPEMLRTARAGLLEGHHLFGRAQDPNCRIVLCLNCHALVTEAQRRGEVPMKPQSNCLDRLTAALKNLAAFFETIPDAIHWLAGEAEGFVKFLDAKFPTWRKEWENWK